MSVVVRIDGLERLLAKLPGVSRDIEGKVRAGLLAAGYELETYAKQVVPVDTGRLKSSIRTEPKPYGAEVGTDVEYAAAVEFGTSRTPSQPYMQPAAEDVKKKIPDLIRRQFER